MTLDSDAMQAMRSISEAGRQQWFTADDLVKAVGCGSVSGMREAMHRRMRTGLGNRFKPGGWYLRSRTIVKGRRRVEWAVSDYDGLREAARRRFATDREPYPLHSFPEPGVIVDWMEVNTGDGEEFPRSLRVGQCWGHWKDGKYFKRWVWDQDPAPPVRDGDYEAPYVLIGWCE